MIILLNSLMLLAIVLSGHHGTTASSLIADVVCSVAKENDLIKLIFFAALLHEMLTVLLARQVVRTNTLHEMYRLTVRFNLLDCVLILLVVLMDEMGRRV